MADGTRIDSVKTTCPYCGVGCGVVVERLSGERQVNIRGDLDHPANFGRLCSKGLALGETTSIKERLLYPEIRGERTDWKTATDLVADKFSNIIAEHGPDAVAFYVSGQLLTEDYYVANKFIKGYIGSANIDTNSRLCMASSVAGHKRAFGADTVPGTYEDLELADLVILTGSNFAWCHPVLYQRLLAAKEKRPSLKIVVIDPRRTATVDFADLHLPLCPGGDVPLFLGLLNALKKARLCADEYVENYTKGVGEALANAADFDLARVSDMTGLDPALIQQFFTMFIETEKTLTVYSQGVNQANDGTDRVNAIVNCHLYTARIGRPGMGPFSITGQPNAMGGREVGGLANQLASHMDLHNRDHRDLVQRFWRSPKIADKPGLKAVDLFDAIHEGKVKAVWIMATNPVVSMPNADFVREALAKCELTVVSEVVGTSDTAQCADVLLPSSAWGEKQGMVTNSERRMSRQRGFMAPPGEARDDWRQICDVAQKMGFADAFAFENASEVFQEFAALCGYENNGSRDLDLSGLSDIDEKSYEEFAPLQWPVSHDDVVSKGDGKGAENKQDHRFFADGNFYTDDKRAFFAPVAASSSSLEQPGTPPTSNYPFVLNTGRIRDQWHTMTRTGLAPRLSQHIAEPFVEVCPKDANRLGLKEASLAKVVSPNGEMFARVVITDRQQEGSLFAPMHWTSRYAKKGRVGAVTRAAPDPISGQPALKSSPAAIEPFDAAWYGFAVIGDEAGFDLECLSAIDYWAGARFACADQDDDKGALHRDDGAGVRLELAHSDYNIVNQLTDEFVTAAETHWEGPIETARFVDDGRGLSSYAIFSDDKLVCLLFIARESVSAARTWACEQIGRSFNGSERAQLLAGRPGGATPDRGAIICSCMNVGLNEIKASIAKGCDSVQAISDATKAGSNCGSCRSDIARLLKERVDA